jgi:hypothetical protein
MSDALIAMQEGRDVLAAAIALAIEIRVSYAATATALTGR